MIYIFEKTTVADEVWPNQAVSTPNVGFAYDRLSYGPACMSLIKANYVILLFLVNNRFYSFD